MTRTIIIFCFSFIFQTVSVAQKFDAHIEVGLNASQIDGDLFSGYNKLGIHGGFGIAYSLNDSWSLEGGLFFDALGSQKELELGSTSPEEQQKIKLTYVSLPLAANYKLSSIPLSFAVGMQVSYLIRSQIQNRTDDVILDFFNKTDIAAFLQLRYLLNERWSISLKASEAVTLIFNNDKVMEINSNSLRNRYLTFSLYRHL